jgi:hypothetical protein
MLRVVIWIGSAGKGFGPVGALVGTVLIAGAGYLAGKTTASKKKSFWS